VGVVHESKSKSKCALCDTINYVLYKELATQVCRQLTVMTDKAVSRLVRSRQHVMLYTAYMPRSREFVCSYQPRKKHNLCIFRQWMTKVYARYDCQ
jgi:hypothetical protein